MQEDTASAPHSRTLYAGVLAAIKEHGVMRKVVTILGLLLSANLLAWIATLIIFREYPRLLATAVIAYTLGLRHAVDADHISAIDNVTRKLLQMGKTPVSVGLFFSLGHSTIVICTSIAVAATVGAVESHFGDFEAIGGIIGTSISAGFLLLIAIMNLIVLFGVYRTLQHLKKENVFQETDIEQHLLNSGLLGRFFRPVFRFIDSSWKMYPLGVLFGLGFDTSTEVALLAISATQSASGIPIWLVLFLPVLFTSSMSLIDTIDGIIMLGAYKYAYVNPVRKLYYNLVITFISVAVALVVAFIEVMNIFGSTLNLQGSFWNFFNTLGNSFGLIGYIIIGTFVCTWAIAALIYRYGGYRELELKYDKVNFPSDEEKASKQSVNKSVDVELGCHENHIDVLNTENGDRIYEISLDVASS